MSQSYLIFSEGRKMQVERAGKITASFDNKQIDLEDEKLQEEITFMVKHWEKGNFPEIKFTTPCPESLFWIIKSAYDQVIIAAGGLVTNREDKLLVIFRKGKWDLPKGKIEDGEQVEEGAIREVMEETGLKKVKIKREFTRTYHTYILNGKRVLKETVWFLMACDDDKTTPQLEESITSVEWISADKLEKISTNTFDNILLLLKTFFKTKP